MLFLKSLLNSKLSRQRAPTRNSVPWETKAEGRERGILCVGKRSVWKKDYFIYLAGGRGTRVPDHGDIGDLHRQVVTVDQGPSTFHFARLELVPERPEVRVAEQAAVCKLGGLLLPAIPQRVDPALVAAQLGQAAPLRARRLHRGRGSRFGTVVLCHEVVDAQHGRVIDQVPPAVLGRLLGALRVSPQRDAKVAAVSTASPLRLLLQSNPRRSSSHELGITSLNPALLATHCQHQKNKLAKQFYNLKKQTFPNY